MDQHKYTNNLVHETSPYLLQHAHNPVNWHAWGHAALQKAKEEDKPVLVSIGYSACHWCHVMERESFEDEETARIMNEHFINIKIDREERPDIDHIYMDAVQAITGSGGWPLHVFLTPGLKPFYGGTYFPPKPMASRNSWQQILLAVANAYKEKRGEITEQAESLTRHLQASNKLSLRPGNLSAVYETADAIAGNLIQIADKEWGGFGQAPKFPHTFSILYLLRYYFFTGNEASLKVATASLDKMMMGGMYDHVGGGFCRYSTDRRWQIPHFEKMLYDNALLIDVYTEAYQVTKNTLYANVAQETIKFIEAELTGPEGGFYSALDADSEGIEGKYYTWDKQEIDALLGKDSEIFCRLFHVSEAGNWEGTNILWQPETMETIASEYGMDKQGLWNFIENAKAILLTARQKRIKPGLDNKVLLPWNALMIIALCKAYAAFGREDYLNLAKNNIAFIEKFLFNMNTGGLLHSWNKTPGPQPAFADGYATLIKAYIFMSQATANEDYLWKARLLCERCIELFSDAEGLFFYFTSEGQADILLRKIELYDGATPSGNALMAENLLKLSVYFDVPAWRQRSENMILSMTVFSEKYAVSFGRWSLNILLLVYGLKEIVVMAGNYPFLVKQVLSEYIPHRLMQATGWPSEGWPLLKGKVILSNQTKIYICESYNCLEPATSIEEFKNQLYSARDKKVNRLA
ncbi:thioredoxin domain-containing protein [Parafilimonas sp.]|uniref:thioredoxin domain-containing protein n=1 Tax=Parafilimonas sp. TaxID=1969739 RepID=UPI0039E2A0FC